MKQPEGTTGEEQTPGGRDVGETQVAPLRKRSNGGELYTRDPQIEALIGELATLSRDELVARVEVLKRSDPRYVPSECLVYFIRAARRDSNEAWFERLYRLLAERVLRSLPRAESPDGKSESLTRRLVREQVFGRLFELVATDRATYDDRLDFFEVRFDGALAKMRIDAQRQARRDENRSQPLEYDEDSGELSPAVEKAAGVNDPLAAPGLDDPAYRLRLDASIDALPMEQRLIIYMLREGFPIDSKEPDVMTISKALGRSEKTIRTHRDKAFAILRAAMADGERQ